MSAWNGVFNATPAKICFKIFFFSTETFAFCPVPIRKSPLELVEPTSDPVRLHSASF